MIEPELMTTKPGQQKQKGRWATWVFSSDRDPYYERGVREIQRVSGQRLVTKERDVGRGQGAGARVDAVTDD